MSKHILGAEKRTVLGRKVKKLRKEGKIPASIFGKGMQSMSLKVSVDAFRKIYDEVGATGIISLVVDSQEFPVLVKNIHIQPVTDAVLHIDFHKVDLSKKVSAQVPLEIIGESAAVLQNLGVLLELMNEIEVEALPTDLPKNITVDISGLEKVGDIIRVKDLSIGSKVEHSLDPEQEVVKIGELVVKEEEPPEVEEGAEGEETEEGEDEKEKEGDESKEKEGDNKDKKEPKEEKNSDKKEEVKEKQKQESKK